MIESLANVSEPVAYISVLLLMILNGIFSFPSSQVLYIFTGYLSSYDALSPILLIIFGAMGNTIGNILQYELVRYKGSDFASRFFYIKKSSLEGLNTFINGRGTAYLFVGKLIPGIKIAVPILAGLAHTKRIFIYPILLVASLIWATIFVYIGILFGTDSSVTKWYSLGALALGLITYVYILVKYPHILEGLSESKENK